MMNDTPNPWLYAKEWQKCSRCNLLVKSCDLVNGSCKDQVRCLSFKAFGHGRATAVEVVSHNRLDASLRIEVA